jgi:hypothetical protein
VIRQTGWKDKLDGKTNWIERQTGWKDKLDTWLGGFCMKTYEAVVKDGMVRVNRIDGTKVLVVIEEDKGKTIVIKRADENTHELLTKENRHAKLMQKAVKFLESGGMADFKYSDKTNRLVDEILVADENAIEGNETQLGVAGFGNIEDKSKPAIEDKSKPAPSPEPKRRRKRSPYNTAMYKEVFGMPIGKYVKSLVASGLVQTKQELYDKLKERFDEAGYDGLMDTCKYRNSVMATIHYVAGQNGISGNLDRPKKVSIGKKQMLVDVESAAVDDINKFEVCDDSHTEYPHRKKTTGFKPSTLVVGGPTTMSKKEFWRGVLDSDLVEWLHKRLKVENPEGVVVTLEKILIGKGYKPNHAKIASVVYMRAGMDFRNEE